MFLVINVFDRGPCKPPSRSNWTQGVHDISGLNLQIVLSFLVNNTFYLSKNPCKVPRFTWGGSKISGRDFFKCIKMWGLRFADFIFFLKYPIQMN